jgi:uncharacterized membrane-anchored protein YhcB (DUF1043 family)
MMDVTDPTQQWLIGLIVLVIGTIIGFFWRLFQHHSKRIDDFKKENNKSHSEIHKKIDDTDEKSQQRHSLLRDKIEEIYKLIVKKGN